MINKKLKKKSITHDEKGIQYENMEQHGRILK